MFIGIRHFVRRERPIVCLDDFRAVSSRERERERELLNKRIANNFSAITQEHRTDRWINEAERVRVSNEIV